MKKVFLLAAFAAVFAFTACNKDDNRIDASQLAGKWNEFNDDPNLSIDGALSYTFDRDGGYERHVYDFLSGYEATHTGTYEISTDGTLITLFDEDGNHEGQYIVLQLNSREMKWKVLTYGGAPRDKKFVRSTD